MLGVGDVCLYCLLVMVREFSCMLQSDLQRFKASTKGGRLLEKPTSGDLQIQRFLNTFEDFPGNMPGDSVKAFATLWNGEISQTLGRIALPILFPGS